MSVRNEFNDYLNIVIYFFAKSQGIENENKIVELGIFRINGVG